MLCYEGIFFDSEACYIIHQLESKKLDKVNDEIHCTFKYLPANNEIFDEIVGKEFEVYLIGYGNDGQNSGFEVLIPDELKEYYINYDEQNPEILKTPHITASLANKAKAVNSKKLNFKKLEKPIKLIGRFGYWIKENGNQYVSYEPFLEAKRK